jgi:hypothetical protein
MDLQQASTPAQLICIWPSLGSLGNSHMHAGATTPLPRSTSQELDLSFDIQLTEFRFLASKQVSLKPGFPVLIVLHYDTAEALLGSAIDLELIESAAVCTINHVHIHPS